MAEEGIELLGYAIILISVAELLVLLFSEKEKHKAHRSPLIAHDMSNDWKERLGVVYSTNPDFQFDSGQRKKLKPCRPREDLRVSLDREQRGGKSVTLVTGFVGKED